MKKHLILNFNSNSNALDGYGITECGSLACLSNPCRNGAICKEIDDNDINDVTLDATGIISQRGEKWQCKCPNGYMGPTCEISVCNDNPCQHGATCVTFPGSGLLCLCPLGTHGHYCEHSKYNLNKCLMQYFSSQWEMIVNQTHCLVEV